MVFYILLIAVLNLGLGYVVSAHLGRRYRALLASELNLGSLEPSPPDAEFAPLPAEEPSEPPDPEAVEPIDDNEDDPGARLIDELLQETAEYRALLGEANRIAEHDRQQLDSSERGDLLCRLSEGTEAYIDQRQAHEDDFRSLVESDELDSQRDSLCAAWEQQDAPLQQVSDATEKLTAEPDCEEFWADFGQQVDGLLAATSDMDSALGEAKTALDNDPDADDTSDGPSDDTADLATSAEAIVEQWSSAATDPDVCPCVALVDVDQVDRLNQQYGRELVDRLLDALFETVQAEQRNEVTVRRMNRQRSVLLFANPDAQRAANIVERIRQTIGKSRFVGGEREIRTTVSCAVGGPGPGDDVAALIPRIEAALAEAKQYGRDRTFLHRGDFPAPVVPPTLILDETEILLDAEPPTPESSASDVDGE